MSKIHTLLIISLFLFFYKIEIYATNLVSNSSFEVGKDFWITNHSGVSFEILENDAINGTRSAKITNNKNSSFGIEQRVIDISSTFTYKITGWIKLNEPYPEKAFIRIAWYESLDASGRQFSTEDSPIATLSSSWQKVEVIKNPPEGINSAKIRLLVASGSAIFDNILVEEFIPPSLTPNPTPLQSSTTTLASLSPTQVPSSTEKLISYENIYLSEVYPNPQTGEKEWVEIYNDNDFIVNLNNWYIDDIEDGGSSPKKFSLIIEPKSYGSFDLSTIMFNNDGDMVRLLDFEKREKDSFEYKNSQKGKSLGRISFDNDEFCLQEPSRNQKNNLCLDPTPTKESPPNKVLVNSNFSPMIAGSSKVNSPINKKASQNLYYQNYQKSRYQTKSTFKIDQQSKLLLMDRKNEILGVSYKRERKDSLLFFTLSFSYSLLSALGVILKSFKDLS